MAFIELNKLLLNWAIVFLFVIIYTDVVGVIMAKVYNQRTLGAELMRRHFKQKCFVVIVLVIFHFCLFA